MQGCCSVISSSCRRRPFCKIRLHLVACQGQHCNSYLRRVHPNKKCKGGHNFGLACDEVRRTWAAPCIDVMSYGFWWRSSKLNTQYRIRSNCSLPLQFSPESATTFPNTTDPAALARNLHPFANLSTSVLELQPNKR